MDDKNELMNEQVVVEMADKDPVNSVPEIRTESVVVKPDNAGKRGSSAVTKKFMVLALAGAILINAGVTAGVMSLTAKHNGHDGPDIQNGGRPGSEMFSDKGPGGNGHMAPPQNGQSNNGQMAPPQNGQNNNGQNNNGQNTPPADAQNNTQDQSGNGIEKDS